MPSNTKLLSSCYCLNCLLPLWQHIPHPQHKIMTSICFLNPTLIRLLFPLWLHIILVKVTHKPHSGKPKSQFQSLLYCIHHQYFTQSIISSFWKHLLNLAFREVSSLISVVLYGSFTLFTHFWNNLVKSQDFKHNPYCWFSTLFP